jgi:hypothetical protein
MEGTYQLNKPLTTFSLGIHFVFAAILLSLGPIQLIPSIRMHYRSVHCWTGRLFVISAIITPTGGLLTFVVQGTVGVDNPWTLLLVSTVFRCGYVRRKLINRLPFAKTTSFAIHFGVGDYMVWRLVHGCIEFFTGSFWVFTGQVNGVLWT